MKPKEIVGEAAAILVMVVLAATPVFALCVAARRPPDVPNGIRLHKLFCGECRGRGGDAERLAESAEPLACASPSRRGDR